MCVCVFVFIHAFLRWKNGGLFLQRIPLQAEPWVTLTGVAPGGEESGGGGGGGGGERMGER